MESHLRLREGGLGWRGEHHHADVPSLAPTLRTGIKGVGQQTRAGQGTQQHLFSLPLCYGMQSICVTHQLLLSIMTHRFVNILVS